MADILKSFNRKKLFSLDSEHDSDRKFNYDLRAFQIGVLLLPSSAFLAGLCFIPALIIGSINRETKFWKDVWNIPLLLITFLMLLGSLNAYSGWLAVVGLGNWLPFFWSFWAFQPYLRNGKDRRTVALLLVLGTIPVFLTGLGQLWFGLAGPWKLFDGLIVWFLTPGGSPEGRLSGLFDYANIAAAWLAIAWPFSLAALLDRNFYRLQRLCLLFCAIAIVVALVLTNSRNAWGGLFLAIPLVLGSTSWYWLIPLLSILLMPIAVAVLPAFNLDLQIAARKLVPQQIWSRLSDLQFAEGRHFATTRLGQWSLALEFIAQRPWLGWGAAAFSVLYPLRTGLWHGHAHNLPLELGVSYGVPAALVFVGMVLSLLILSLKQGVLINRVSNSRELNNQFYDRAWWAASFILLAFHATDMPFFDSRINIAGWILLAGLRCIILPINLKP